MVLSIINDRLVLFGPYMGPKQVLPLWVRVNLGVMATEKYTTFPKTPRLTII